MRVALTAGESMDLVLLHDDGTRTDVRIENDPDQSRPVITAINQRRRAPLVVLVNGERKLP